MFSDTDKDKQGAGTRLRGPDDAEREDDHHDRRRPTADPVGQVAARSDAFVGGQTYKVGRLNGRSRVSPVIQYALWPK